MQATFKNNLKVSKVPGTEFWTVLEPLIVEIDNEELIVPAGTQTDFASVPRLPIMFMMFGARADCAATVHDYLYQTKKLPREQCDEIFRALMLAEGLTLACADAMYEGVRVGGESHYET